MPFYCASCSTRLDDRPGFSAQDPVRKPCPQCGSTVRRFDYTGNARVVYTSPDALSRIWHVATSAAAHPHETTIISAMPTDSIAPPHAPPPDVPTVPTSAPASREIVDPRFLDPKFKLAYRTLLVILAVAFATMVFGWLVDERAVALAEKVILLAVGAFIGLVTGKSVL